MRRSEFGCRVARMGKDESEMAVAFEFTAAGGVASLLATTVADCVDVPDEPAGPSADFAVGRGAAAAGFGGTVTLVVGIGCCLVAAGTRD